MKNEKEDLHCSSCLLCMPQANIEKDFVCAGYYYGKQMTDEEADKAPVCEDYEPNPPDELFFPKE